MIQSCKFDSSKMEIKKLANSVFIFTIKRLIEIIGIFVLGVGILLLVALITYSPTDPNFIFPKSTEIKNLLGFHGSYVSDLFFQSFGLISYLIPVTYIFAGSNIFKRKEIFILIESNFFIVLYALVGSLFFSFYYENAFILYINGNGGFVGNYFNETYLKDIISSHENIFYYFLISIITIFFLEADSYFYQETFDPLLMILFFLIFKIEAINNFIRNLSLKKINILFFYLLIFLTVSIIKNHDILNLNA